MQSVMVGVGATVVVGSTVVVGASVVVGITVVVGSSVVVAATAMTVLKNKLAHRRILNTLQKSHELEAG